MTCQNRAWLVAMTGFRPSVCQIQGDWFYLSGHPLDDYLPSLKRKQFLTLDDVTAKAEKGCIVKMAGTVSGRQERKSARGNRFLFVQLSDGTVRGHDVQRYAEASRDHAELAAVSSFSVKRQWKRIS